MRSAFRPARTVAGLLAAGFLAAGLGACATPGTNAPIHDVNAGMPSTTRIEGPNGSTELRSVSGATPMAESAVAASADKAFGVLPEVYESLGIRINTILSASRTLGMRDARVTRRLGRAPLSRYIDCGTDATNLPNADSYMVTLTALSRVSPAGDSGSAVVTQVVGSARPMTTSGNTLRCGTTGRLEQAINRAVVAAVAR